MKKEYLVTERPSRPPIHPGAILRLDVLPGDEGVLPEIEISWLLPEQELPEARRLSRGYTLHLDLQPQAPNRLAGNFHLVLPPRFKTSLSGRVELFSDGLRYKKDGQVNRQIDSLDTLKYVIEDYLQRRFVTRQVQLQPLAAVSFPAERLELQVQALIAGQQQRVDMVLKKSLNRGWAVESDSFASLPEPAAAPSTPVRSKVVAAPPERVSRPLDRRIRFSLDALLRSPSRYHNLSMRVATERGNNAEGRFQGVDQDGRIMLRQRLSGQGEVSYSLRPEEVVRIELLEP